MNHTHLIISCALVLLAVESTALDASSPDAGTVPGTTYSQHIVALGRRVADPVPVRKAVAHYVMTMPAGRLTIIDGGDGRVLCDQMLEDGGLLSSRASKRGGALATVTGAMREVLAQGTSGGTPAIDVQLVCRSVASMPGGSRILVLLGDPTYVSAADVSFSQRVGAGYRYPTEQLVVQPWTTSSLSCGALDLRGLPVVVWSGIDDRRHDSVQAGVVARQLAAARGVLTGWSAHPALALSDPGTGSVPISAWLPQQKAMMLAGEQLVGTLAAPAAPTEAALPQGVLRPEQIFTMPVTTVNADIATVLASSWSITLGWRSPCDLDLGVAVTAGEPAQKVCTYNRTPLIARTTAGDVLMTYAVDNRRGDPGGLELESITLVAARPFNPIQIGLVPQVTYYSGTPINVPWQMRIVPADARVAYARDGTVAAPNDVRQVRY